MMVSVNILSIFSDSLLLKNEVRGIFQESGLTGLFTFPLIVGFILSELVQSFSVWAKSNFAGARLKARYWRFEGDKGLLFLSIFNWAK